MSEITLTEQAKRALADLVEIDTGHEMIRGLAAVYGLSDSIDETVKRREEMEILPVWYKVSEVELSDVRYFGETEYVVFVNESESGSGGNLVIDHDSERFFVL